MGMVISVPFVTVHVIFWMIVGFFYMVNPFTAEISGKITMSEKPTRWNDFSLKPACVSKGRTLHRTGFFIVLREDDR